MSRLSSWSLTLLLLTLLTEFPLTARAQQADTLFLTDGERVVGDVHRLALGDLRLDTPAFGAVHVAWERVTHIDSPKRWDVRTSDGAHYQGWFRPSPLGDERIRIDSGRDTVDIGTETIVQFTQLADGLWSRADGSISLGLDQQNTNKLTQVLIGAGLGYVVGRDRYSLTEYSAVTAQPGAADLNVHNASLYWTHDLKARWSSVVTGGIESNSALDLSWRLKAGYLVGNRIVQQVRLSEILLAGLQLNWERARDGEGQEESEFAVVSQFGSSIPHTGVDVVADLFGYLGLSHPGRNRLAGDITANARIVGSWKIGLTFHDQYDRRPRPGAGASNAYQLGTTLAYTF